MKKKKFIFLIFLMILMLSSLNLKAACLGEPIGIVLDFYDNPGVTSVVIVDNYAYVSINLDDVRGLAKVDLSNPENFKSYIKTYQANSGYTIDQYLKDISDYVTIYYYGKEFNFNQDLSHPLDSYIVKGIKDKDGNVILFGYSQNYYDNSSFLWSYNVNNQQLNYIKIDGYKISKIKEVNGLFFVLLNGISDDLDYKVAVFPITPLDTNDLNWEDFEIYDLKLSEYQDVKLYASYEGDDEYEVDLIYPKDDNTIVKILDYSISYKSYNLEDTEEFTIPFQFDGIVYEGCNFIILNAFDKLIFIQEKEAQEDQYDNVSFDNISSVELFHIYKTYLNNNILYVANMGGGIDAVDISNPYNPQVIGTGIIKNDDFTGAASQDITYSNGIVAAALGWDGLAVFSADSCKPSITDKDYYKQCENSEENDNYTENNNYDNTSEENDNCCFNAADVEQAPTGWYLAGTGCDITDMNIFNNVKTVWYWNNNSWMIYSNDPNILKIIQKYNIPPIVEIPAKRGFWINK